MVILYVLEEWFLSLVATMLAHPVVLVAAAVVIVLGVLALDKMDRRTK